MIDFNLFITGTGMIMIIGCVWIVLINNKGVHRHGK